MEYLAFESSVHILSVILMMVTGFKNRIKVVSFLGELMLELILPWLSNCYKLLLQTEDLQLRLSGFLEKLENVRYLKNLSMSESA